MILAAGMGTRLRPLTDNLPKIMLPIAGRPLIDYIVRLFREHGIEDIAINLHHKPETVREHLGDGQRFGVHVTYSFEEKLLGTAGALGKLRNFFTETFVAINGDMLSSIDISAQVDFHRSRRATATIALFEVADPTTRGVVELDGDRRIRRFVEKPPADRVFSNLVNAGVYVIEPEVLNYIPDNTLADLGTDTFPLLLQAGKRLFGYPSSDYLLDIGTLASYKQAEEDVLSGKVKRF
jgi:mannose-1-phosphate guanylyltransferase/phosphomannomutase